MAFAPSRVQALNQQPLPLLANAFSIPHAWGLLALRDGSVVEDPVGLQQFGRWAVDQGLMGIDVPWSPAFRKESEALRRLESPVRVVLENGVFIETTDSDLHSMLADAVYVGAKVVRFLISRNLCGNREFDPIGWNERLCQTIIRLRTWMPRFRDCGVSVAFENHQDATLDDMFRLIHVFRDDHSFGICFDTGNPLAVGQSPIMTMESLAPWIRHVHLKDYKVHHSDSGFRLVRCKAGTGVVDFERVFEVLRMNPDPNRLPSVEIAAQQARDIPLASPRWLSRRDSLSAEVFGEVLKTIWERTEPPDTEWRTPWEMDASSGQVVEMEWKLLSESIRYFNDLWKGQVTER